MKKIFLLILLSSFVGLSQAGHYMASFEEEDVPEEEYFFKKPNRPMLTTSQLLKRKIGYTGTGDEVADFGPKKPSSESYYIQVRKAKAVLFEMRALAGITKSGERYDVDSLVVLERRLGEANRNLTFCTGDQQQKAAAEKRLQGLIAQALQARLTLKPVKPSV